MFVPQNVYMQQGKSECVEIFKINCKVNLEMLKHHILYKNKLK